MISSSQLSSSAEPSPPKSPADSQRVLVLQGGGALGSYQAGAFQALRAHNFEPSWVAGISIGAINAAIIVGNHPEQRVARLHKFWELVSSPVPWQPPMEGHHARLAFNETSAALIATFGVPGFFVPRIPPAPLWPIGSLQSLSFYDTTPLKATLHELVDFDLINSRQTRLSIGAVNVKSGNFVYFDNMKQEIRPEHIMASGALPPGFPAVEIDGEFYWDGGVASNTPLDYVLEEEVQNDLLVFQVDLFSARGALPTTLLEAAEREKDIRYSSRTRLNTDMNKKLHNTRKAIRNLIAKLPPEFQQDPNVAVLSQAAKENTVTVVHLIYKSKSFETSSKDYDFSHVAMEEHWASGIHDVDRSMEHPEWLERPQNGETMVTYDLTGDYPSSPDKSP